MLDTQTLQRLFNELGFVAQCIDFDHILPDADVQDLLKGTYRNSRAVQCLLQFPDLLVIKRNAVPPGSVFLVKIARDPRLPEALYLGTSAFPLRVVVVQARPLSAGKVELTAHWLGGEDSNMRLVPFLQQVLVLPIAASDAERAEQLGYLIT